MYPVQCYAGFAMPVKKGKFEIYGFSAPVSALGADSQFAIVDDVNIADTDTHGRILSTIIDQKNVLANAKGLASATQMLEGSFSEPIKTRRGISVLATNLVGGSVCVYVR